MLIEFNLGVCLERLLTWGISSGGLRQWRVAQAAVHLPGFYEVDDVFRGNSRNDGGTKFVLLETLT